MEGGKRQGRYRPQVLLAPFPALPELLARENPQNGSRKNAGKLSRMTGGDWVQENGTHVRKGLQVGHLASKLGHTSPCPFLIRSPKVEISEFSGHKSGRNEGWEC